jgi:hypothetical protein
MNKEEIKNEEYIGEIKKIKSYQVDSSGIVTVIPKITYKIKED